MHKEHNPDSLFRKVRKSKEKQRKASKVRESKESYTKCKGSVGSTHPDWGEDAR